MTATNPGGRGPCAVGSSALIGPATKRCSPFVAPLKNGNPKGENRKVSKGSIRFGQLS